MLIVALPYTHEPPNVLNGRPKVPYFLNFRVKFTFSDFHPKSSDAGKTLFNIGCSIKIETFQLKQVNDLNLRFSRKNIDKNTNCVKKYNILGLTRVIFKKHSSFAYFLYVACQQG